MKNQSNAVECCNRFLWVALAGLLLTLGAATVAQAKSLYVITEIVPWNGPTPIAAYDIGSDGLLTFQVKYRIPFEGGGAVGLAVDSDSESLFVTYEYTNKIRVIDAATMQERTAALAQDANDLAGIVYDHDKKLLYCIDRKTANLYCYRWNADAGTLNIVPNSPFELKDSAGYGIALDEIEDQLYVVGSSSTVRVYKTSDWSVIRTFTLRRTAISVAVDPKRGYLYAGGGYLENYYLTQYNLVDGTETEVQVAPDAGVMGLAVDPVTGYIYLTTGRDNRNGEEDDDRNDMMVYDTHLNQIQVVENVGYDPTAIVIPGKQTSYNPLRLVKVIEEGSGLPDPGAVPEVPIGGEFTYNICFEHNEYVLSDIVIVDTLPQEVTFVRADGNGQFGNYDPGTHTYIWRDPPLAAGFRTCLSITVQVKPTVAAGAPVTNSVTIDTAETPPTTTATDAVAAIVVEPFLPLNVSKIIISGVDANDPTGVVYADAGARITYRICYDNRANTQPVTNVTLVDALPGDVAFVGIGDRFGQYDRATHTCTWTFPSVAAGASDCVEMTVQLGNDVPGGAAITNRVTIDSDETTASTASAVVVASYEGLLLTKRIKSGTMEDPNVHGRLLVNPGAELTYEICISNPSSTRTVTHLSIVDMLPAHTRFVSAERDQEIGYYDDLIVPTYTWFYGSLAPGAQDCLDLVVRVDEDTEPNTLITNKVTVSAREAPSVTTTVDVVVPKHSAVACDLLVKPTKLYRDVRQPTSLMAVLHLPEGCGRGLIVNEPLVLQPGNIPSLSQRIFGTDTAGAIMAFFDPQALLNATAANGDVMVKVSGKLTDGRAFQGQRDIEIHPTSK